MKNIVYLLLLTAVGFSACKNESFKKTKEGQEYRIISSGGGKLLKNGNFMEMGITVKYKDSVLFNSYTMGMPQYAPYDTAQMPPSFKEIFKTLHVGDSVIIKESTDSLIKRGQSAPFMKKGEFVFQHIKFMNAYATEEEMKTAATAKQKIVSEGQLKKDDKILTDYFAKNNIKATKTPLGAYAVITQQGTGPMLDSTVIAKVKYTGKTLDGKVFDSNTDPTKGTMDLLTVNLTSDMLLGGGVIPGMSDGLKMFNKGAKGQIYIPSSLGYGPAGSGGVIAANTNLAFDVEVSDVLNKQQAAADMEVQQRKMEALQKKYTDSMSKIQPQQQAR